MTVTRNPKHVDHYAIPGYTDLGWQLSYTDLILVKCREAGHERREVDNSLFIAHGTDVITICDECKYLYHTDMSD